MDSSMADHKVSLPDAKREKSQKSKAAAIVASFGAGLASLSLAPSVEASVINLTFSPGAVDFESARSEGSRSDVRVRLGSRSRWFKQYNDQFGKSFYGASSIMNFRTVDAGEQITAGQDFRDSISRSAAFAGTSTFGFFYWPFSGLKQVGWIRISFGGLQGPVTFLAGAMDSRLTQRGGRIHAGQVAPVPEPSTLALIGLASLALGARGVRRWRESRKVP